MAVLTLIDAVLICLSVNAGEILCDDAHGIFACDFSYYFRFLRRIIT